MLMNRSTMKLNKFQMSKLDEQSSLDIGNEDLNIINAESVTLFYVYSKRMAWHSTWSCKYTENCMHLSKSSAKKHAESLRTNGSVFQIVPLPSLMFKTSSASYFVTQINTDTPFSDYCFFFEEDFFGKAVKTSYAHCGSNIYHALRSFKPDSVSWRCPQPNKNSLMIYGPCKVDNVPLLSASHYMPVLKSKGGNKLEALKWFQTDKKISNLGVNSFIEQYQLHMKDYGLIEKNVSVKAELPDYENFEYIIDRLQNDSLSKYMQLIELKRLTEIRTAVEEHLMFNTHDSVIYKGKRWYYSDLLKVLVNWCKLGNICDIPTKDTEKYLSIESKRLRELGLPSEW